MSEEIIRLMLTLRPALLVTVALTLVVYVLLMLLVIRRLKVNGTGSRLAAFFVGLDGRSLIHFSFAWTKFAFFSACLLLAKPVTQLHYLLLVSLAAMTLLLGIRLSALVTELFGTGLLLAGLSVSTTLLQYLQQVRYDQTVQTAYWLLAVFLILCAAAVLLREIPVISEERNYFDESGETA